MVEAAASRGKGGEVRSASCVVESVRPDRIRGVPRGIVFEVS